MKVVPLPRGVSNTVTVSSISEVNEAVYKSARVAVLKFLDKFSGNGQSLWWVILERLKSYFKHGRELTKLIVADVSLEDRHQFQHQFR